MNACCVQMWGVFVILMVVYNIEKGNRTPVANESFDDRVKLTLMTVMRRHMESETLVILACCSLYNATTGLDEYQKIEAPMIVQLMCECLRKYPNSRQVCFEALATLANVYSVHDGSVIELVQSVAARWSEDHEINLEVGRIFDIQEFGVLDSDVEESDDDDDDSDDASEESMEGLRQIQFMNSTVQELPWDGNLSSFDDINMEDAFESRADGLLSPVEGFVNLFE